MATAAGPWIKILLIVVLIAGALFTIYKFALPPALKLLNIQWPPATPAPPTPTPVPTPSPHPIQALDATEIQTEIEIPSDMRFATDPMRHGNEIVYTGGVDDSGSQKNVKVVIYDIETRQTREQNGLQLTNDDYFQPQLNDKWIVYLDQKRDGGGLIRAYDRESGADFVVKEYYVGQPVITLSGSRVCWIERTGSYRDKVFLFDLTTQENVCLETFESAVFGQSACHMSEKEIIWAGFDVSGSTDHDIDHGTIQFYNFEGTVGNIPETYAPETYVHNPKTNGNARAWIDANGGPNATLYLSLNGGEKRSINTNVLGFGLGSNFLAYCKDEVVHVYFWDVHPQPLDREISLKGEHCIFSGVSDDAVFWFDTGISKSSDIMKFAMPNEIDILQRETPSSGIPTIPTTTSTPTP